jgi:hypothetical protein
MPSDFTQLIADIEREAHDESPRAVRELEQLRAEFKGVGQTAEGRSAGDVEEPRR